MIKCGPKERGCIEKNFTHTFNCNMTCEGIYADVQRLENNELTNSDNTKIGEEVDKMKFQKLIAEYKNFKRNNVQHFRFDSESNQTAFGQF